jgi:molybdopterin/thiamine biosynthesis adenylyltransferase
MLPEQELVALLLAPAKLASGEGQSADLPPLRGATLDDGDLSWMRYTITFEAEDFAELRAHLLGDPNREEAAYLLCGVSRTSANCRWLVRRVLRIPREGFLRKEQYGLTVSAALTDAVLQQCRREELSLVLVHSHPFDRGFTRYSGVDDRGEAGLFDVYYKRLPRVPHASLLFGADCVTGRHWTPTGQSIPLDEVRIIGRRVSVLRLTGNGEGQISPVHERQVLAFGREGQARIVSATAAVVGLGGTGSITAEQLARLGIGRLILIDHDRIEMSNLSRVFGSVKADAEAGRLKVEALGRWLAEIAPEIKVECYSASVLEDRVAKILREVDVIFGCTDNHTTRALLNQVSFQYLIPYIDMGNRLATDGVKVTGGTGRVVLMTPRSPCLWCYEDIRAKRIAEEALPREEREKLAREGYIEGADIQAPSVVSLNTTIAGLAVTEFLNLFAGFMPEGPEGYKLHYRVLEQTLERVVVTRIRKCVCTKDGDYWAFGDLRPLPTLP